MRHGPSDRYDRFFVGGTYAVWLDGGAPPADELAEALLTGMLEAERHVVMVAASDIAAYWPYVLELAAAYLGLTKEAEVQLAGGEGELPGLVIETRHRLGREKIKELERVGGDASGRVVMALLTEDVAVAEQFGLYVAPTSLQLLIGLSGERDPEAVAVMHRRIERKSPLKGRGIHFDHPECWPGPDRTS